MTPKQRTYIFGTLWKEACHWQGWSPNDRAKRLEEVESAVGRKVDSMADLDQDEITSVIQHFGTLGYNLDAAMDAQKGNAKARQYAWKCRNYFLPRIAVFMCSGIFKDDLHRAAQYVAKVVRDRFKVPEGRKVFEWIQDQDETTAKQVMMTFAGTYQRLKKRWESQAGKELSGEEIDKIAAHIASMMPMDETVIKARGLVFKMAPRSIIEDCVDRIFGHRRIQDLKDVASWKQVRNAVASQANQTRHSTQQPAHV